MKTAFLCDAEGTWGATKRLSAVAAHYGFTPRRCQVRRPETKGKVERTIGYLDGNFWLRMDGLPLSLAELIAAVTGWWFHSGCRGKQRPAGPLVGVGSATTCQSNGFVNPGVPFPPRNQRMEQDRASSVLVHQHELAGSTIDKLGCHRQLDSINADCGRNACAKRA